MKAKPSVLLFFLTLILTLVMLVLGASAVDALTVYPIDRAQILAGSRFDFKVEFDGIVESADTKRGARSGDGHLLMSGEPKERR
jgi:alkaline phosphatase